jgi:hypothetical protein
MMQQFVVGQTTVHSLDDFAALLLAQKIFNHASRLSSPRLIMIFG